MTAGLTTSDTLSGLHRYARARVRWIVHSPVRGCQSALAAACRGSPPTAPARTQITPEPPRRPAAGKQRPASMGKRSTFERREGDFYPTPRSAVLPLIPWLRGVRTFAEPCCGDGALVRHLDRFGLRCVYAGDIRSGQDALALDHTATPTRSSPIRRTAPAPAPADPAFPEHRADLAADRSGLERHQTSCPLPWSLHRHHRYWALRLDSRNEKQRKGQFRLVPLRRPPYRRPGLSPVSLGRPAVAACSAVRAPRLRQALPPAPLRQPFLLRQLPPARSSRAA